MAINVWHIKPTYFRLLPYNATLSRYVYRPYRPRPISPSFVCLSVCLSQACVLSKRQNIYRVQENVTHLFLTTSQLAYWLDFLLACTCLQWAEFSSSEFGTKFRISIKHGVKQANGNHWYQLENRRTATRPNPTLTCDHQFQSPDSHGSDPHACNRSRPKVSRFER